MGRVSGKVAIVTGAARGIGAAIAKSLVAEGAKVMLTDMLDAEGKQVAEELGSNARFMHHDVTSAADWESVVAATEAAFGPIGVLVNNAGILGAQEPIEKVDETEFRRVMEVNVTAVFLGIKATLPSMRRAGGGSIVNISSAAGLVASPSTAAYTASKFAVRGLTKGAALDVAGDHVRVNSVHPGFVETKMIAHMIPAENTEEFTKQISPIGRLGKPADIANMVLFLASDESAFATGAEFIVDGGFTCR